MSRIIKFRSWLKNKNEMIYDFGLVHNNVESENETNIIMQYTDVHDATEDEVEIYEDDIIELIYEGEKHICKVSFEAGGFILVSCTLSDNYISFHKIIEIDREYCWIPKSKVIGNTRENPELLEGLI